MGIFSKAFKGSQIGAGGSAAPFCDAFLYDPEFQSAHRALAEGSWAEAQSVIARRPDGWLLTLALTSADSAVSVDTFARWAEAEPSGTSIALHGASQIRAAWKIRGDKTADQVSRGSWAPFKAGLGEAEETLLRGTDAYPESPEPWAALLNSGRGLGKSNAEIRRRFDMANARAPFRGDICSSMLQASCEKWGGSHAEMFQFARWVEGNAPPGGSAHSMLPKAHLEKAMYEDDLTAANYFTLPEVSHEMKSASRMFLASIPDVPEPEHLSTLNHYIYLLIPTDRESADLVTEIARRLGDRPTEAPWTYWNDSPGERFARVRNSRLKAARRF